MGKCAITRDKQNISKNLTFFRSALHQGVAVGLACRALTQGLLVFHNAEGIEATASVTAGVNERTDTETAGEGIPCAAHLALAVVSAHKILQIWGVQFIYFISTICSYLTDSVSTTRIAKTLILVRCTLASWIANIIRRASTLLLVSDALALGVDSTGIRQQAEVDTGAVHTALGRLTVIVPGALHLPALHLGVSLEPLWADADGSVVGHPALRRGGTPGGGTGILALARHTLLLPIAVIVPGAAWEAGAAGAEVALWAGEGAGARLPTPSGHTGLAT